MSVVNEVAEKTGHPGSFTPRASTPKSEANRKQKPSTKSMIPILNKDTAHPDTYDIEYLLDRNNQRIPLLGHRLKNSTREVSYKLPLSSKHRMTNFKSKSVPNPSTVKNVPNVKERFRLFDEEIKRKLESAREEKEEKETQECSFKPSINRIPGTPKPRSAAKYFKDMQTFQRNKEEKIRQMQEVAEKLQESQDRRFSPMICEGSLKILANTSSLQFPVHERLHKKFKSYKGNEYLNSYLTEEFPKAKSPAPFTPSVNKKSKNLQRTQPIETTLYNDALRRMSAVEPPTVPLQVVTSKQSWKILVNRFLEDFDSCCRQHNLHTADSVNYIQFLSLMESLNFIKGGTSRNTNAILILELWNFLSKQQDFVNSNELKVGVMGIMGYYEPWMSQSALGFNRENIRKFHQKFVALFENRGSAVKQPGQHTTQQLPKRQKLSRQAVNKLFEHGKEREKYLSILRYEYEAKEMNECTFKPTLRPSESHDSSLANISEFNKLFRRNTRNSTPKLDLLKAFIAKRVQQYATNNSHDHGTASTAPSTLSSLGQLITRKITEMSNRSPLEKRSTMQMSWLFPAPRETDLVNQPMKVGQYTFPSSESAGGSQESEQSISENSEENAICVSVNLKTRKSVVLTVSPLEMLLDSNN